MVAGVGAADGGRVAPGLPRHGEVVHPAGPAGAGEEPSHGLEVQSQLTHVIRYLEDMMTDDRSLMIDN